MIKNEKLASENGKRLAKLIKSQIPLNNDVFIYVNTQGLTNKNINEYLKLLADNSTLSEKYKQTSAIKQDVYEIGGVTMSEEMRAILDSERAIGKKEGKKEGMIQSFVTMVKKGFIEVAVAAKELGMSKKEFIKIAKL